MVQRSLQPATVLREFGEIDGKYRVRLIRSSQSSRVHLDIREFVRGSNYEGFTRKGVRIQSLAGIRALREALEEIEKEGFFTTEQ
jgi:hypothetical protein